MNIIFVGFGNMGRAAHSIALDREHEASVIIDPVAEEATHQELTPELLENADMVIDFARSDGVLDRLQMCADQGVNLVMGTTGWYDNMDKVREVVEGSDIGFFWSSNFSIGVNVFFKIVEEAAKLMNQFDEYDVWGHEIHHYNKADSPSGTAKVVADLLLKHIDRKKELVSDTLHRKIEPHELHFSSVRGGPVNFGHIIGFDSVADTITVTHSARNRSGYALGAVKAAEWLQGKKGFFEMSDFLHL